jgi:diguanylate cyclase (GGDEF)-like protein/PAS domain S-box-containing protein
MGGVARAGTTSGWHPTARGRAAGRFVRWLGAPFGPSQSRFMSRSLALGFLAGAVAGGASRAFPGVPGSIPDVELLAVALAIGTGLALLSGVLDKAPAGSFFFVLTWGVLLTSLAAYGGSVPESGGELFYLWVVPYAFAFYSLRLASLLTALAAAAFAGVLLLQHRVDPHEVEPGVLAGLWFLLVSAEVAIGLLVRRLGRSLREVDLRFRHAFAHSPVGAAFLTPAGQIVEVNDALCAMLGRRSADLVGASFGELAHPEDRQRIARSTSGEVVPAAELRLMCPDGQVVWAACSATLITPEVGAPYLFGQFEDVTKLRRDRETLSRLAIHDPLTGLFNRTLVLDRLERAVRRGTAVGGRLAVILLDLDQFKLVNDSLGHHVGDELLRSLAPRLSSATRPGDILARLGGDEFIVLCRGVADLADALARAGRISAVLREPLELVGRRYVVNASIGVAIATGWEDSAAGLLRDADAAMYRAKSKGRNRIEAFDESMREEANLRLELERALRAAVEREELSLVYQPIVDLGSGRPTALEALVRWNPPDGNPLDAGTFVHLAEETGVIIELGRWVLDRALADLATLQAVLPFGEPLRVNVNVSARQLFAGDFAAEVRAALARHGVAPQRLGVEITESVLIPHTLPPGILDDLRELDVALVLDDFGTGYSSLAYIGQFPVDVLKIDRRFVTGLLEGRCHAAVVEAILTMARALSIRVVAEGVENPAQLHRLRELGCAEVQGNMITAPLALDEVARFCRELDTMARALQSPEHG